jgi:hypothetical protein
MIKKLIMRCCKYSQRTPLQVFVVVCVLPLSAVNVFVVVYILPLSAATVFVVVYVLPLSAANVFVVVHILPLSAATVFVVVYILPLSAATVFVVVYILPLSTSNPSLLHYYLLTCVRSGKAPSPSVPRVVPAAYFQCGILKFSITYHATQPSIWTIRPKCLSVCQLCEGKRMNGIKAVRKRNHIHWICK